MRRFAVLVVAAIAVLAPAGCAGDDRDGTGTVPGGREDAPSGDGDEAPTPGSATVVRIVDGDTIVVRLDGDEEKVRLIGIDTPETVDPRKPVQCFGKEASAHTAKLIPPGTSVRLVRDVEARDRYDRLLAYVYRAGDGMFVNLALARDGYAQVATFPPNVAHVDALREAAAEARADGRGLWSACSSGT